jgi:acyl-CoA synthetase (AMP-forming)/AMP-acid ligase II
MTWQNLNQTWHYVEKWAEARPAAEAMVFGDERITWAGFKNDMDRVAKAFLEAGVQKGDRIAMLSMARTEFPTTFMAAGKIGAMWLGLSPKFTLDELRFIINDCRPTVLISLKEYMGKDLGSALRTLMAEFDCLKKVLVIGGQVEGAADYAAFVDRDRPELDEALAARASEVDEHDEALLLYTSGSTGKPKGVVHTHRSIVANIRVEIEKFYFDEGTRILLHFPINHVAADVEIGFGAIMGGACLVLMDRFDPAATLAVIPREKISALGQIPAMFLMEFKDPSFGQTDLTSLRSFLWAGAAAPRIMIDVLGKICGQTGAFMLTGYGSTETCGFVTYTEKGDGVERLLRSAGKIALPFELKIVDENRREVPDGQVGEIAVRGDFLMKGYFNNPQATAAVIDADGWYYTADLASRDADGYIYIAGRRSEMYKSGGENVYPREIEDLIETHPSVLFAAVIGVPDEIFQEVGWAYAMLKPGQEVSEEKLQQLCREKLANFKVPKRFFVRPLLPMLASGKVDKMALKKEAEKMLAEK